MTELKPCPFCGKPITEKEFCAGDGFPKGCNCMWETHSADDAEKAWNTRPIEDSLREELEEWKKHADRLISALENLYNGDWVVESDKVIDTMDNIFSEYRTLKK